MPSSISCRPDVLRSGLPFWPSGTLQVSFSTRHVPQRRPVVWPWESILARHPHVWRDGLLMPDTHDLLAVRQFTTALNDRLRQCDNGEGMVCRSLDERINYYVD